MIRQKMMNEQDTAEWYLAQMAKVKAAKAEASKPRPSTFRCCNQLESEGHHKECVNFQPEGETKKNRIVEHIPNFASGFDPRCVSFDTLEELMEISWVKSWKEAPQFHRYSADSYLMVEREDGHWWWAIGRLRHPVEGLPKWEAKYKDKDEDVRRKTIGSDAGTGRTHSTRETEPAAS